MKTITTILAIAFMLTCSLTFAQPGGGGQGGQQGPPPVPNDTQIEKMVTDLANEVALSTDQKTKVIALYKDHFTQVKAKTSGNSRPKREEMEALDRNLEKLVKAELTEEQTSKYEAWLKEKSKQQPQKQR